ncbi:hypothetical protein BGX31_005949 [Mortierella sp. GBA43]|nr:hypothetical protein BGX31_005949 [Mortierella sp. GBA43]
MNLVKLRLVHVELFKRDASEHEGSNENDNKDADDIHDDHTLCLTNPLGHLKASLLELSMKQMGFEEKEFYYALRDIAGGSLRTLKLGWIVGSLDLHGLVFESLTRLHLWLRRTMKTDMFEIIGRSPHLDHLELYDAVDPDDWFQGGYVLCDLEPLAQFLRGTPTMDPSTSGSTHRQWTRPQLATLRLHIRHMVTQSSGVTTGGNNPQYLELIRACSNTYDKFKRRGYLGSLRELVFSVHNLDDDVREVIEIQGEHLEVLRIAVISNFDPRCERIGSIINHSLALAKIFQSCRRLKEFEYESWYSDADIRTMMEILIEKIPEASWDCRDLESLQLYSSGASFSTRPEEERWFVVAENTKDNNNHVHGSGTWRMPSFKWDPKVNDGTAFLLDAVEGGTGRSKDGEELIRRFLRHISPSKKLKNLQLAQLKFVRPCAYWMVAFDGLDC